MISWFVTLDLDLWQGPDLRKKTSLLTHLFDCCGLGDLIVRGDLEVPNEDLKVPYEDLKALHVTEKVCLY